VADLKKETNFRKKSCSKRDTMKKNPTHSLKELLNQILKSNLFLNSLVSILTLQA
jgi:hypothetical protein